jgi:hypothetical protein
VGLLGNDQDLTKIEDQIKILATNVEVLNQVLVKDPNAMSGGNSEAGGITPQQFHEILDSLKAMAKKIETYDGGLRDVVNQEMDYIKTTLQKIQQLTVEYPRQKQELDIVVKRLNNVIEAFNAADKASMSTVAKELHDFNQNMVSFNENMQFFQQKLVENINFRVNEVGMSISDKLARTGMIGVAIFVIAGILMMVVMGILK